TNFAFFQKFGGIIGNVKDYFCSPSFLFAFFERKVGRSITGPMGCWLILIALGDDLYFFGDHKGRIETQAKMADNTGVFCRILVFIQEFLGPGESNFIDILLYFLLGHTHTLIYYMDFLPLLVYLYFYNRIVIFNLGLPYGSQVFKL